MYFSMFLGKDIMNSLLSIHIIGLEPFSNVYLLRKVWFPSV
jgi:hypothetical protein